jgi:hypothetical protein
MGAIVCGILIGACIFGIVACILSETSYFEEKEHAKLGYTISSIIGIIFGICMYFITTNGINVSNESFCASFEARKETYESAMNDENVTSLERLQITEKIMEINAGLAQEQVSVVQWYNFNLSEENKENTLSLTIIK